MGLPFFDSAIGRKRDQMMAVDLGSRTTKAVCVSAPRPGFALGGFALLDAPIYEKTLPPDLLGEHLKAINQALQSPTRYRLPDRRASTMPRFATLTSPACPCTTCGRSSSSTPSPICSRICPAMCSIAMSAPRAQQPKPNDKSKDASGPPKQRVLVAGARKQFVDDYVAGRQRRRAGRRLHRPRPDRPRQHLREGDAGGCSRRKPSPWWTSASRTPRSASCRRAS